MYVRTYLSIYLSVLILVTLFSEIIVTLQLLVIGSKETLA